MTYLIILHEQVKLGQMQTSNFKPKNCDEIDMEVTKVTGEQYVVKKLKGKFFRMQMKHRNFSDLIRTTGVTWDTSSDTVHAAEETWQQFYAVYLNSFFFNIEITPPNVLELIVFFTFGP